MATGCGALAVGNLIDVSFDTAEERPECDERAGDDKTGSLDGMRHGDVHQRN